MRGRHSSRRDNPCHERSALPPCIISTSQQSEAAWLVPVVVAAAWLAACWLAPGCLPGCWLVPACGRGRGWTGRVYCGR
jgi:hypothetical protein